MGQFDWALVALFVAALLLAIRIRGLWAFEVCAAEIYQYPDPWQRETAVQDK